MCIKGIYRLNTSLFKNPFINAFALCKWGFIFLTITSHIPQALFPFLSFRLWENKRLERSDSENLNCSPPHRTRDGKLRKRISFQMSLNKYAPHVIQPLQSSHQTMETTAVEEPYHNREKHKGTSRIVLLTIYQTLNIVKRFP